jgi:hypothetical protein
LPASAVVSRAVEENGKSSGRVLQKLVLDVCMFRSFPGPAAHCPARMTWCRSGGIEFLSRRRFDPDSTVYIRVVECGEIGSEGQLPEGFRCAGLAWVTACRPAGFQYDRLFETKAVYYYRLASAAIVCAGQAAKNHNVRICGLPQTTYHQPHTAHRAARRFALH